MNTQQIQDFLQEAEQHLKQELLPFWLDRSKDEEHGGFITHFDKDGKDAETDEKSLIAQTRCVYTFSSAHRAGYGEGKCLEYARHGVDFLINHMWDREYGGFYWLLDRKANVKIDEKILYGHSFAIYSLCEYTMASGDDIGLEYACKVFDLIQKYCADTMYGGYFEMFTRDWQLKGPGAAGGDRKTLDVHMHLMEAFTSLYECSQLPVHRRKLLEVIDIMLKRILHPKYRTGVPQFYPNWEVAPQIKFDIVWGWDRFTEDGAKKQADDNTSYGHNVEFAWLFTHALKILKIDTKDYVSVLKASYEHAVNYGIDETHGGVYVEGSHAGEVYDREKEFWQQAEVLIGMLQAYLTFGDEKYLKVYENVHRFVFDKMIHHPVGEWWPLLSRKGEPVWTHMSHSWKVNYHTVRAMVQSIERLKNVRDKLN
ncbi:mannose/cellobiose epimerase-like protein (N-acyl-D-glucosamine 2-epimerase family) [Catalinimonas alkaloidigena]|uniref:AGE family epimerase/isomerase n=1 Tax=Catalinimonas alkaloidigena TaxID=1075417 RepID=UPI0024068071|nr:AGE family epimerase/isomerase [Catalinimonas alkaloidigena]MDF9799554.1 mannose/cellobiose epimerase-like protein (N-acyl-D-glucosamine 2-epimerase family) [Catalinimonas alkaloidigena]